MILLSFLPISMYSSPFYITTPVWNNAFSFETRTNKKLFVPSLKEAKYLSEIELWNEIVFEDFDEDGALQSCFGLKNFYKFNIKIGTKNIPLYLVDNHNHVLFFWYQALYDWILKVSGNNVLHIDEHADTRIPDPLISPMERGDVWKTEGVSYIFHYTNFVANVGNYMIPAQKEWLIWEIFQIRDEASLESNYNAQILNLDLDFFSPRFNYISYQKKKGFILKNIEKADIITVCTSPFFISQTLALDVFKDIFGGFIPQ